MDANKSIKPEKLEKFRAEAEELLGEPMLLTEDAVGHIEVASHVTNTAVTVSSNTKSPCC